MEMTVRSKGRAMTSNREAWRRAAFLDRDGVINQAPVRNGLPYAPESVSELKVLPGVVEAINMLRNADYMVIVVTNQPDVGACKKPRQSVEEIHDRLLETMAVNEIRVCYHTDLDRCRCRKPQPGMILDASREHTIDLSQSFLVGDRWRDVDAGKAAGCKTYFIDLGYKESLREKPDHTVQNLPAAIRHVLRQKQRILG